MLISDVSVRRPVFAAVISLILVILGLMSASGMTIREYPAIERPTGSISTNYRGAASDIVERRVTQVLEDQCTVDLIDLHTEFPVDVSDSTNCGTLHRNTYTGNTLAVLSTNNLTTNVPHLREGSNAYKQEKNKQNCNFPHNDNFWLLI